MLLFKIVISVILLIGIIYPRAIWMISYSWRFKNAEPSEVYLIIKRVASALALLLIWLLVPNSE